MSHPFKGPVTILGYLWDEDTVKTKHNSKDNGKFEKNNLTNNFAKNLDMYFNRRK